MDYATEIFQEQKKNNFFKKFNFKYGFRIGRIECLALMLNFHVLSCLIVMLGFLGYWPGYLGMILYSINILGACLVAARRMHDFNCSGLWLIFLLIPYVGMVIFAGLLFLYPGISAPNRFGEQSKPSLKRYCVLFVAPFIYLIFLLLLPYLPI